MRIALILACLATPATAETVCVPGADLTAAAKAEGLALTFEGFLADGSACPVAAGDAHDITLGSLT